MIGTVILPCTCEHKEQDKLYGKGMRVHNVGQNKGRSTGEAACTVCCPNQRQNRMHGTDDIPPNPVLKMDLYLKKEIEY